MKHTLSCLNVLRHCLNDDVPAVVIPVGVGYTLCYEFGTDADSRNSR